VDRGLPALAALAKKTCPPLVTLALPVVVSSSKSSSPPLLVIVEAPAVPVLSNPRMSDALANMLAAGATIVETNKARFVHS
jgi:hypothetical protein